MCSGAKDTVEIVKTLREASVGLDGQIVSTGPTDVPPCLFASTAGLKRPDRAGRPISDVGPAGLLRHRAADSSRYVVGVTYCRSKR